MVKVRKAKQRSDGSRAGNPSAMLWLGLAGGALVALETPSALLLGILLAPGLIALAVERSPGRPIARCVLLSGLAAAIMPVRALWAEPNSVAASLGLALDPSTLGLAWSAAAAGWLLCELAPFALERAMEASSRSRIARLHAKREALEAEWGFPPLAADTKNPQPDRSG